MSLLVCDRNIFYDQSGKSNYYLEMIWKHTNSKQWKMQMKMLRYLEHWCQMIHINSNFFKKMTCKVHQVKLCNNKETLAALNWKFNSFHLKKEG